MQKKELIAPALKNLAVYDSKEFPLVRYSVINTTIQRIQTETPLRFTQKKNKENATLKVTRIA